MTMPVLASICYHASSTLPFYGMLASILVSTKTQDRLGNHTKGGPRFESGWWIYDRVLENIGEVGRY